MKFASQEQSIVQNNNDLKYFLNSESVLLN